ncbi:MAG: hypothetical protein NT141_04560 [candidate division WWE3 bacterium]|nr:hypothetical protein [candidate division WWE3 bacterium]
MKKLAIIVILLIIGAVVLSNIFISPILKNYTACILDVENNVNFDTTKQNLEKIPTAAAKYLYVCTEDQRALLNLKACMSKQRQQSLFSVIIEKILEPRTTNLYDDHNRRCGDLPV